MNYQGILLKLVKAGLFLVLLTPLVMGPWGLTLSAYPKAVFFRSLIEIVFILYLFLLFFDRKYFPRISLLSWLFLLFIASLLITGLAGFNFYRSFFGDLERAEGILLHLHFLAFFLMLSGLFTRKEEWFKLFKVMAGVSGISSFIALLQRLDVWHFYGVSLPGRVSGTLSNPDFFGPYIVLSIFLTLFVFLIEKEKDMKFVWTALIFLHSFTLILSRTRGAWVALALALLFCFFLWFFKYSGSQRKKTAFLVLALSFILLILVVNKDNIENGLLKRALSVFELSFGSRGDVWEISLEAFKENPLLGWGPESFSYVFYKYFKADYFSEIPEGMYFDYAHNKVFNLLVSSGLLGLFSWLALLGGAFYLLFKKVLLEKKLVLILSVFLAAYFFQSLTVFDTISIYLLLFSVLAFINVLAGKAVAPRKEWVAALGIPLLVLSLFSLYFVNLKPTLAASAFPSNIEYEQKDPSRAVSEYSRASEGNIYKDDLKFITVERGLLLLEKGKREEEIVKTIYRAKDSLESLAAEPERRPVDTLEYLARTYQWNYLFFKNKEDLLKMEETAIKGMEFNDERPEFHGLMAELKLIQGREEEAKELFRKRASLFPLEKRNYYRDLGAAFVRMGEREKASQYFKKAVERIKEPRTKEISFIESVAVLFCRDLKDLESCKEVYQKLKDLFPERKETLEKHLQFLIEKYF